MTSSGTDAYTVANREDAIDFTAGYAEYGEPALVHERDRGRGGLLQLAQDAAGDGGDAFRSVHNDTGDEAELLIFSPRLDKPPTEKQDDFWPSA